MFQCPECQTIVHPNKNHISAWCTNKLCVLNSIDVTKPWFETLSSNASVSSYDYNAINQSTEKAYQIYAKFYAFFALLAYWIIWRGKILQHIKFFREILDSNNQSEVVDLATGEGSLTELALFKGNYRAHQVVVLDLSKSMLEKAAKRLAKRPVILIRGDVMKLPFQNNSITLLTCFGGFNSFPDFKLALNEMLNKLKPEGRLRASFLLMPNQPWKQKKIREWINKGYQTIALTESEAKEHINAVLNKHSSHISEWNRLGDVLLFEIKKSSY